MPEILWSGPVTTVSGLARSDAPAPPSQPEQLRPALLATNSGFPPSPFRLIAMRICDNTGSIRQYGAHTYVGNRRSNPGQGLPLIRRRDVRRVLRARKILELHQVQSA